MLSGTDFLTKLDLSFVNYNLFYNFNGIKVENKYELNKTHGSVFA